MTAHVHSRQGVGGAVDREHILIREYHPSMDNDTMHDWAVDAVAHMRQREAEILAALSAISSQAEALEAMAGALEALTDVLGAAELDREAVVPTYTRARTALSTYRQTKEDTA